MFKDRDEVSTTKLSIKIEVHRLPEGDKWSVKDNKTRDSGDPKLFRGFKERALRKRN